MPVMKILESIQEQHGARYQTLIDAIGWSRWAADWQEDFSREFKYHFTRTKPPLKRQLKEETMDKKILEAVACIHGETYKSVEDALLYYTRKELLDVWLQYEGLLGYTSAILNVMEELGYDIDCEE